MQDDQDNTGLDRVPSNRFSRLIGGKLPVKAPRAPTAQLRATADTPI